MKIDVNTLRYADHIPGKGKVNWVRRYRDIIVVEFIDKDGARRRETVTKEVPYINV